jgi:phosphoribosylaminoimidazolecarboxamide formyltransferase/IMP cyclohydrolase
MHESTIIQRALLSVYDKTNIIELAERLHLRGVQLISTGNTAALLKEHGLPVTEVGDYTGFPEIMQGRVKTLHPKIHGGILGRRDVDADVMIAHDIQDIDLVIVNLYPFQAVTAKPDCTVEDAIENIDIGGPTMIRGAAKNFEWCTVLTSPDDYIPFMEEFERMDGMITRAHRLEYAAKAFAHTASYESSIAQYFVQKTQLQTDNPIFSAVLSLQNSLKEVLRYGENPHQQAAFYQDVAPAPDSIASVVKLQGKELSFNNIVDADTALECVKQFAQPACVIVKHANPCGSAISDSCLQAYDKAYACDPTSAFGGIIAFNHPVDESLMQHILGQQFVEVLIAPDFSKEALVLASEKPLCRVLQYRQQPTSTIVTMEIKSVNGGILIQSRDHDHTAQFTVVTKHQPSKAQMADLKFGWDIAKFVKSNAIVFVKNGQTLGIGAGQMSRIVSTEIAAWQAEKHNFPMQDAIMASDAFFPFIDNIQAAHALGIKAIIQPGGSKRDNEVIACANDLGIAMIFTGVRHFRH